MAPQLYYKTESQPNKWKRVRKVHHVSRLLIFSCANGTFCLRTGRNPIDHLLPVYTNSSPDRPPMPRWPSTSKIKMRLPVRGVDILDTQVEGMSHGYPGNWMQNAHPWEKNVNVIGAQQKSLRHIAHLNRKSKWILWISHERLKLKVSLLQISLLVSVCKSIALFFSGVAKEFEVLDPPRRILIEDLFELEEYSDEDDWERIDDERVIAPSYSAVVGRHKR